MVLLPLYSVFSYQNTINVVFNCKCVEKYSKLSLKMTKVVNKDMEIIKYVNKINKILKFKKIKNNRINKQILTFGHS